MKRLIRPDGVLPIASALLLYTAIPKLAGVGKAASVGHDYSLKLFYIRQDLNYHTFLFKIFADVYRKLFYTKI